MGEEEEEEEEEGGGGGEQFKDRNRARTRETLG
jgi:hypothetical protein